MSVKDEGGKDGRQGQERQGKGSEAKRPETAAKRSEETGETAKKNLMVQSVVFSQKRVSLKEKRCQKEE
jgi:hypothetical protein